MFFFSICNWFSIFFFRLMENNLKVFIPQQMYRRLWWYWRFNRRGNFILNLRYACSILVISLADHVCNFWIDWKSIVRLQVFLIVCYFILLISLHPKISNFYPNFYKTSRRTLKNKDILAKTTSIFSCLQWLELRKERKFIWMCLVIGRMDTISIGLWKVESNENSYP